DEARTDDDRAESGIDEDIEIDVRVNEQVALVGAHHRLHPRPNGDTVQFPTDIRVALKRPDRVPDPRWQQGRRGRWEETAEPPGRVLAIPIRLALVVPHAQETAVVTLLKIKR